ncbi:MAG: hypothetical protein SGPRY_011442, partial [Prymnesium sp.]
MASSPDLQPSPREEKWLNPLARHARALRDSAILEEQTLSQLDLPVPPSTKVSLSHASSGFCFALPTEHQPRFPQFDDEPTCKRSSADNLHIPPPSTTPSAGASSHTLPQ